MGFWRGLLGPLRKASTTADKPAQWLIDWMRGSERSSSGITISQAEALEETTCLSCVSIRASDLAKLPVHAYQRRANGGRTILKNHPIEGLLRKPNHWQTRLEFIEMMQVALLLEGNAYAIIRRDSRARPTALFPWSPLHVCVETTPDAELYYSFTAANDFERALIGGGTARFPADDVVHLRWLSTNGLLGLGRRFLAKDALGLSLALEEHSARLFANGARPSGVLQTDRRLSDATFKRLRRQWDQVYSGVKNAGRTPILEDGIKWNPQTMTSVEAETIAARDFQTKRIAMAFDVPLHRLGIMPEGGAAAILQAHQMYLNNTLSNDAERWEAKLADAFGLDGEEAFVAFDLDYFNRADLQSRMTSYRIGVVGMVMTPNEARRREGWPDVSGGDTLYQPTNVAPIGYDPNGGSAGPGSDVTGAPAPGGDGDPASQGDSAVSMPV